MAEKRQALEKVTMALQELRKEQATLVSNHQKLDSQLQENEIVEKEFKHLKDNARIYKLIGPVLVPQEKAEATTNVQKRLEYIRDELKRVDARLKKLSEDQQTTSMDAYKLQMELQNASTSASA
ncbi:Prefoldin subunit 6 [Coemansia guatemalensis]|uniref:Prefoldin subunit 6 n=1 Tax=Coemansia guatemalensis TaxID=2761395 RepID=A0A9W8LSV3_9FUNG|nr:Prefoldin subunit 6 [Coemansia guatemalensis]KAJ2805994.1 Prefoldin subunit 6 [Coemansia guatemalensis]